MKNSFFQTFGAFGITGFNFMLSVGYARFLGPAGYGSLVTSQAEVMLWTLLVDLGLNHSLIGTLTSAEKGRTEFLRQGFRARDLLFRVLLLRFLGAILGTFIVFEIAQHRSTLGSSQFWQDMAYTPYLFGYVVQQTGISLAMYRHRQGLSVSAYLGGVVLSVLAALYLAGQGAPIAWLLFAQSCGGFFTGIVLFGYFAYSAFQRKRSGDSRRQETERGGHWGPAAWQALGKDAWPYAITAAVLVLWQRLDQLVVSKWIGLEAGGQYGLAVRLVGTPILVATSICFAIFPDMQRIGLGAPERVKVMLAYVLKFLWRYGILAAGFLLLCMAAVVVPVIPKFLPAVRILPYFVPGLWAFWMQSFLTNALFGLRAYKSVVKTYLLSIVVYVIALSLLAHFFGLLGVVWSFNCFCFAMIFFGFREGKRCGLLPPGYYPWNAYTKAESNLLKNALSRRASEGAKG